ncbi:MAG: YjgN family protein [Rhodospirillaceae bacterium]|nr:YjgN family protein [Rhodospirillaceae bacterium]
MTSDQDQDGSARSTVPVHKLNHDGRGAELVLIFLVNLALTILTLGIYRFWAKTRIRQYVWRHTSLLDERLEYTGRGLEMFIGFLFALVLFYGPIIGVYVWLFSVTPSPGDTPAEAQIQTLLILNIFVLVIIFGAALLYYVALFAAYRYRASRTSWFGIRGGMEGSAWTYGFLGLGLGLLNVMSLFWTKPWADSVVFKYRLSRSWFGSKKFESTLDSRGLWSPYALAWAITAIASASALWIFLAVAFPVIQQMATGSRPPSPQVFFQFQIMIIALFLVPIIAYQLGVCWYKAALVRNIARNLSYDSVRFRTEVSGGEVFALRIPNFLLMMFTLGLAYPYVVLRVARFIERHVEFHGDIQTAAIEQNAIDAPWYGEGLMEFLGVGMI